MTTQQLNRYHALAVAFDSNAKTFDHRHRAMSFGFASSPDGIHWHANELGRPLGHFQKIRVSSESSFVVHVFTDDTVTGNRLSGLVISARPSIDSVAAGRNPKGPFVDGPNIVFNRLQLGSPVRDVPSAALNGQTFGSMWATDRIPFVHLGPGEARSFEILVELQVEIKGQKLDFKIDPELVIEGDFPAS